MTAVVIDLVRLVVVPQPRHTNRMIRTIRSYQQMLHMNGAIVVDGSQAHLTNGHRKKQLNTQQEQQLDVLNDHMTNLDGGK